MKCILLAAVLFPLSVFAAEPPKRQPPFVSIDRAKVDADYAIQGEYSGMVRGKKTGIHVIALGAGEFELARYEGGLPGDGWNGDKAQCVRGKAFTSSDPFKPPAKVFGAVGTLSGYIGGGKITTVNDRDVLNRVERKSPTLGAKPPAEAIVLFDGTNTDAWEGSGMSGDKLLKEGQTTKPKFRSYTIHLEFMTAYKPDARGQERGNSGFYNQSRYEVQVLDSFGLEGNDNECGGIYSVKAPDVNMCLPPLQWQTYDIDFTAAKFDAAGKKTANARATVSHNGVVIHRNVEIPRATTAAPLPEGPEPGPLHLQNHGNPVRYRNIWIVEKK